MANPRPPASDGDVRFQVYMKVTHAEGEEFKIRFDFRGNPRQGVDIYCNRNLSEDDEQRLKDLAAKFVARIVFKVQLVQGPIRPTWWRPDEQG
jgi:hypothetical protein